VTSSAAARALPWAPALAWAVLIFALSDQSRPPQPPGVEGIPFIDKLQHTAEYGILAALLLLALRRSHRAPGWAPAALDPAVAILLAAAYAATDEVHQMFVAERSADVVDWVFDVLGASLFAWGLAAHIAPRAEPLEGAAERLVLPEGRVAFWSVGGGPAVLHIHGWRGSKRYFEGAPAALPGRRHIALDLLGFGDSSKPARFRYGPAEHARVAREVARNLGVEHAVVVGHSMGGAVALALARDDPAFVEALVLVEPALHLGVPPPFPVTVEQARSAGLAVWRMGRGDGASLAKAVVARPGALDDRFIGDAMKAPFHAAAASLVRLAAQSASLVERPPAARVLLVFGDPAFGVRAAYAKALAAKLPGASVRHVEGTNHCPMIEEPDVFWGLVRDFLEAGGGGRSP
jgi:pimeloyl-ACP methyl ester carboxylesterase/VanZ family protein